MILDMTDNERTEIAEQAERDREQAARRDHERTEAHQKTELPDLPWDVRAASILGQFIATVTIAGCVKRVRRWLLMALSFAFTHARGLVGHNVVERRRATCALCPNVEYNVVRSLPLLRRTERMFCKAKDCGCGKSRCAALTWKTRLANFACPIGKFGRGGWFPQEDTHGTL